MRSWEVSDEAERCERSGKKGSGRRAWLSAKSTQWVSHSQAPSPAASQLLAHLRLVKRKRNSARGCKEVRGGQETVPAAP